MNECVCAFESTKITQDGSLMCFISETIFEHSKTTSDTKSDFLCVKLIIASLNHMICISNILSDGSTMLVYSERCPTGILRITEQI
jgi:hypothetical protein